MSTRPVWVALGALALAACGPGTDVASDPTATPGAIYADFAPCDPLPDSIDFDPIEGMVAPDGMVVADVRTTGTITSVTGFVDLTPLELRDAFEGRDDVEVIHVEDEGYEAEILVDSGSHRSFVKGTIRCRTGSIVAVVVAPDDSAGQLPQPGGS